MLPLPPEPHVRSRRGARLVALAVALIVAACEAAGPSDSLPPTGGSSSTPGATPPSGPTPLIVDTDVSTDDIVAIAFILREPSVDVRAITVSGTGVAYCGAGLRIVRSILDAMGRTDVRIGCGRTDAGPAGHPFPDEWRSAADTGYGVDFPLVTAGQVGQTTEAASLIPDVAKTAGRPVHVLALGPYTNIADALQAWAPLASSIGRIVSMAGAIEVPGNVQPSGSSAPFAAEWNVYADPASADAVFRSGIAITLVPLDATNSVPVTTAFLAALEADHAAAGADIAYELYARRGVVQGEYLWDPLAAVVAVDPAVATFEQLRLRVETAAGPTSGSLTRVEAGPTMTVATSADATAFQARLLHGLRLGAARPHPFTLVGTYQVTFDGRTCSDDVPDLIAPGNWAFDITTSMPGETVLVLTRFHAGATWQQLLAYLKKAKDSTAQPDFVDAPYLTFVTGHTARLVGLLDPGLWGVVCLRVKAGAQAGIPGSGAFTVQQMPSGT